MYISDTVLREFIQKHEEEIEVEDYSHLITLPSSWIEGELICNLFKRLHDAKVPPFKDLDSDLFGSSVSKAREVYRSALGKLVSHTVRDWKADTWNQPVIKELIEVIKLLGVQVYLFENKNLQNNQRDYLLINPKNKLEQVLPYLNKDHYTANELEDFQQI